MKDGVHQQCHMQYPHVNSRVSEKAIYAESVEPAMKSSVPERVQFPDLMTPDQHLEAARRYVEEQALWKQGVSTCPEVQ